MPVSTPEGIVTEIVFCFFIFPEPLHFKHGFLIEVPSPAQVGHGRSIEKKPEVETEQKKESSEEKK